MKLFYIQISIHQIYLSTLNHLVEKKNIFDLAFDDVSKKEDW